jgi:trypsin-like peptidase
VNAEPWRLRIRHASDTADGPGPVAGAGFTVAGDCALTCAHVVKGSKCWVDAPGSGVPPRLCAVESLQPGGAGDGSTTDIAVISGPVPGPPAALGSAAVPAADTELEVVGFPKAYARHPAFEGERDRDERSRLRVSGPLGSGLIQVRRVDGHPSLEEGYSGSAALDVRAGRVVGLLVEDAHGPSARTDRNQITPLSQDRVLTEAWVIPLAVIARRWSRLAGLMVTELEADPRYARARDELDRRDYGAALSSLNSIYQYYPREADVYYYRVLAALAGQRPGGYGGQFVEAIVNLLRRAVEEDGGAAHVQALLNLVNEDYYAWRGIRCDFYPPMTERQIAERIRADHVREILKHVPARECSTWIYLGSMI